ncbi:CRISPR-associated protein, Cse4 family [Ectothiorhodospira sp. PHS-1]|nr:CRISPR-associated protein, Cse4 family [Ectothiorhodospira sp. PHS-1]
MTKDDAMTEKNFLNIHVLISHSPSCLNRDDMNMQKSAVFGGVRRVRISSQSLKRAMRTSEYYREHLGQPSMRTRHLDRLRKRMHAALEERYPPDLIDTAIEWLGFDEGKVAADDDFKHRAVAPWVAEEIASYCEQIKAARDADEDEQKLRKEMKKQGKRFDEALRHGLDVALSGRMATSGVMTSVDGAMSVAHALTTHAVDADIDWFTAVDDLVDADEETGAGHLNTQEFSAGVFYRYASLNLGQLQRNLGGADRQEVLEIASHLIHLMATVVPSAKQQAFAAHNLADVVMVSFSDLPISLANAFETPVRSNGSKGFLEPSTEKLMEYSQRLREGYGLEDETGVFSTTIKMSEKSVCHQHPTLKALKDWVAHAGV